MHIWRNEPSGVGQIGGFALGYFVCCPCPADLAQLALYCCSWTQLAHLHQQRIALLRGPLGHRGPDSPQADIVHMASSPAGSGPPDLQAPTGCPTSLPSRSLLWTCCFFQHNQLRAQDMLSRLLSQQAEHFKQALSACQAQLSTAHNNLSLACHALTLPRDNLDSLAFPPKSELMRISFTCSLPSSPSPPRSTRRMASCLKTPILLP